jgi:uncharacterized protein YndB with AHSA1/START domain
VAQEHPRHDLERAGVVRATVISVDVDFRVGGKYRYVLRSLKGPEFGFGGTYREIGDDRIVSNESFDGYPGESLVTTTFVERGGKTTMTVVVRFESQAVRDGVLATGMANGAGESYDALEAVIAAL